VPPEDDPGATEDVRVLAEPVRPDVPEPEELTPDRVPEREPAWPVVALPWAAPCAGPGRTAAIDPVAAALAMTIAAVTAESRRMPRRLSAEALAVAEAGAVAEAVAGIVAEAEAGDVAVAVTVAERPDEWAAIGGSLPSQDRGRRRCRGRTDAVSVAGR